MKKIISLFIVLTILSCSTNKIDPTVESDKKCLLTQSDFYNLGKLDFSAFQEYDSQNNLVKEIHIESNKNVSFSQTLKNEYDSEKNLVKITRLRADNSVYRTETYTYHSKGKIKTHNIDYSANYYERFEYNLAGLETLHIYVTTDEKGDIRTVYSPNNQILEKVSKSKDKILSTIKYTYNAAQKLVKTEDIKESFTFVTEYFYDEKNNLIKTTNNKGMEVVYTYSPLKINYTVKNKAVYSTGFREELDSYGNILKKYESTNGIDYVLIYECSYFMNQKKNIQNEYFLKPNSKTETFLIIETKFNENGDIINYRNFSSQSKVIDEIKRVFKCD
jgi:hypothetical protein